MLLVSQRWLAVDVLLDVFSLVAVPADPVTSLVPLRMSRWPSRVVASAREAPWHHRPHKRARSLGDFPSLDEGDAFRRRSLLVSKTIANLARYPERRPAGVVPAGGGSLDIDQIWIFWGRRLGFSRSQLLQHIADHALADSGRRRFLLHSDHDGRTWVSVAAP